MIRRNPLLFLILIFVFLQILCVTPLAYSVDADIVIYADTRSNHDIHRNVVSAILKLKPSVVFHLGDFVDTGSSTVDWAAFNDVAGPLLKTTEFYPVIGNHEGDSELFFRNFKLPENRTWYSVERAGIHFTILNSNADLIPNSSQYQWLESDLRSINDKIRFRIVLMHEPIFSVVRSTVSRKRFKSSLLPLFARYGIAAVFSGHDHAYERFLYKNIYYIATGGGGANLHNQRRTSLYLQKFIKDHHFCALTVIDGFIKVSVFDTNLNLIDEFNIPPRKR